MRHVTECRYYHWREGTALARKSALERSQLYGTAAFLDPISADAPRGLWAVRLDDASGQATVRSLLWPGCAARGAHWICAFRERQAHVTHAHPNGPRSYFFYHAVGTPRFGGAYFGDGMKNEDLGFTA